MLNESIAAAVKVSRGINVLEGHGISILEENHQLIGTILKARQVILAEQGKSHLPITFGLSAIEAASEAQSKLSTAMRLVAKAHEHLAADKVDAGISFVSYGDVWPCPTGEIAAEQSRPSLSVVA